MSAITNQELLYLLVALRKWCSSALCQQCKNSLYGLCSSIEDCQFCESEMFPGRYSELCSCLIPSNHMHLAYGKARVKALFSGLAEDEQSTAACLASCLEQVVSAQALSEFRQYCVQFPKADEWYTVDEPMLLRFVTHLEQVAPAQVSVGFRRYCPGVYEESKISHAWNVVYEPVLLSLIVVLHVFGTICSRCIVSVCYYNSGMSRYTEGESEIAARLEHVLEQWLEQGLEPILLQHRPLSF